MGVTNRESGTRVDEVAEGIYRINTPVSPTVVPGGFSFNQYLIVDERPLLFHTGPRRLFPLVREAVQSVVPFEKLQFLGLSHYESDECGALNSMLAVAPKAVPLCGQVAALVTIEDVADRAPHAMKDGEVLALGKKSVQWLDMPHLPHGWECGYIFEATTRTLLCGDLFTQGGADSPPLTESDILGPSEQFRKTLDYYSGTRNLRPLMNRLIAKRPQTLACMHGSAWRGDCAQLLGALADSLEKV